MTNETKAKCTPGPWHVRKFDGSKWSIDAEGDLTVAQAQQVRDLASDLKQEERSANARLIAAAPDMLDALRVALNELTPGSRTQDYGEACRVRDEAIKTISDAIAKAKGA